MAVRCLIVDDSEVFLDAARTLLESDGVDVVGAALTGREGLQLLRELQPEVALIDVQLRDESGIDIARQLSEEEHGPKVILISTRSEDDLAEVIESAPVEGFIPKHRLSAASIHKLLSDA